MVKLRNIVLFSQRRTENLQQMLAVSVKKCLNYDMDGLGMGRSKLMESMEQNNCRKKEVDTFQGTK